MESNTTWDIKCINSYIMPRLISVLVNWKIYFCYRIINIISAQSNSDTALPTHSATMMKLETCREFQSIISITQYFLDLASKSNDYDNYTELVPFILLPGTYKKISIWVCWGWWFREIFLYSTF